MPGLSRWASTVMMLESRPPDRKLDTGTSATRWAATDSSITAPRSAGGPAAASAATSAIRQYCCTVARPSGVNRAHDPAGSLCTPSMAQRCSGSQ